MGTIHHLHHPKHKPKDPKGLLAIAMILGGFSVFILCVLLMASYMFDTVMNLP
jgi:hypothetical protein